MNLHSTTKRTEDTKTAQSKGFQSGLLLRDLRAFVVKASPVHGSNARVATR
ncbi:MAG: hypothetical protein AB7O66_21035 [Limisphaerales bacterium]